MASTVLILGANGRFGLAAAQAFSAAGWRVIAQVRHDKGCLPASARVITTPLEQTAKLVHDAAGATVVVHAVNPPYTEWMKQVIPTARQAMDIAQGLQATFMLPGNVYNFGKGMPSLLREDTEQRPSTQKGRIRCDLEAEMKRRSAQGLRSIVIRAGDFFGGGNGNWIDMVIAKSLNDGKLAYPGPMELTHAWAYLPDLARAFVALAEHPPAGTFARFHFGGHSLTGIELLGYIERAARSIGIEQEGKWSRQSMPWAVIRIGGLLVPMWREIAEMAYLWKIPHALDQTALVRHLGTVPHTPIALALQQTLVGLGFGENVVHPIRSRKATA